MSAARLAFTSARRSVNRFAFAPARPEPLAVLRIGLALVLLGQAALVAPAYYELYSRDGVVTGSLRRMVHQRWLPNIDALVPLLAHIGLNERQTLTAVGISYALSLLAMLVGLRTRTATVFSWVLHLLLLTTGAGTNYGADWLAQIALFYLVWAPSGAAFSLDRALARTPSRPSSVARLSLRVVQLQLCIVYLTSGLAKLRTAWWRDGDVIWRVCMTPKYRWLDLEFSWLALHPWLVSLIAWAVLSVEVGYAVLVWPRRTRRVWLFATVGLHLGIALVTGLVVFGALMIVLTVAAFGVEAEPQDLDLPRGAPGQPDAGEAAVRHWSRG